MKKKSTLFFSQKILSEVLSENRSICPKNAKTNFVRKSTRQKNPYSVFLFFLLFYIELFTEMSENTLLKAFSITYL